MATEVKKGEGEVLYRVHRQYNLLVYYRSIVTQVIKNEGRIIFGVAVTIMMTH
jgi:hypothetical protein